MALERKKNRWLIPALVAALAFFATRWAFARPKRSQGDPDVPSDAGKPGRGEQGTPRPERGGVSGGRSSAQYLVPDGWDPVRGLWISPDCRWVVEGPGWWNGLCLGASGIQVCDLNYDAEGWPKTVSDASAAGQGQTVAEHIASEPSAGALGFADNLLADGVQPEDIASQIMAEYAPMCADVDPSTWSDALKSWYASLVRRITAQAESMLQV